MKDLGWCVATKKEIEALEIMVHVVRCLFLLERALGSELVYKIRYHSDGNKEHLKTRLDVFSNHQVEGNDYTDTFAPTAKITIVRAFLAVVVTKN